jgi:hypothetical protein
MSYNLNLLNDNEKRSLAVLSLQSVIRISTVVAPIIFVFVIGIYFINYLNLKQELKSNKIKWSELKNREKTADELAAQSNLSADILKELKDWNSRAVPLYEILIHLMVETPEDLYLKTLDIQRKLVLNEQKLLQSSYGVLIKGIIYGDDSENRVVNYKNMLKTSTGLKNFVDTVKIDQYDENLNTEDLDDKIFMISIQSTKKVSK